MKVKDLEIDYNVKDQQPILVDIELSKKQVKQIVENYFNSMEYKDKQEWIKINKVSIKTKTKKTDL